MDARAARRAAEKAARDLISDRAALVGQLGVLQAERTYLADAVAAARVRARQLVIEAEAEGKRLVTAARELAQIGEQRYADAYGAATTGGWTPVDLTALGFTTANTAARRRQGRGDEPEHSPPPLKTLVDGARAAR